MLTKEEDHHEVTWTSENYVLQQNFHISLDFKVQNKLIFILLKSLLIWSFLQNPILYSS